MSDEEHIPDEDCNDVEHDVIEDLVQVEKCESESEIEGDDLNSPIQFELLRNPE